MHSGTRLRRADSHGGVEELLVRTPVLPAVQFNGPRVRGGMYANRLMHRRNVTLIKFLLYTLTRDLGRRRIAIERTRFGSAYYTKWQ